MILVDELRFPRVFPEGIHTAAEFLARFMPHTYELWRNGVKFANHYTAGVACTPARGCLISGLYTQQSWLAQTILSRPDSKIALQPSLNRAYPTYGKLLRDAGYKTPYIGKWHASLLRPNTPLLDAYGFDGMTLPDPTGSNLQGTVGNESEGYLSDGDIAKQAVRFLHSDAARKSPVPWCLTVSFINPHDKEFFWAGTEFERYNNMFPSTGKYQPFTYYSAVVDGKNYEPLVDDARNPLKNPRSYGYPVVPPNWETDKRIARNKPSTQTYTQLFSQAVWGGVRYDPAARGFSIEQYPIDPSSGEKPYGVARAPFNYWQRALDSYTQCMEIVDERIGEVLNALLELPRDVFDNTVIVFTSDHGEYAGAHGYPSGKVGSLYDEAYHIPLIVADPTRRFNGDIETIRSGLTSTVDMLPLLVGLGHNGSREWLSGDLRRLYGGRHDMLAMLRSAGAPGRRYVLTVTDEVVPGFYNFNQSPTHLIGMRTEEAKVGVYANWVGNTDIIDPKGLETEYYDYTTERGRLELDNDPDNPEAARMRDVLLTDLVRTELRAPLPLRYRLPQALSREGYLKFNEFMRNYTQSQDKQSPLPALLGYGKEF